MSETPLPARTIRLVAVDMDGTFLSPEKSYDGARFARIRQTMRDRGITFVVASGNQYWQLAGFFPDHPDNYYLAENGAFIVGPDGELRVSMLADATVSTLLDIFDDGLTIDPVLCGHHSAYASATVDPRVLPKLQHHYTRFELVDDLRAVTDGVLKFTAVSPAGDLADGLARLIAEAPADVAVVSPGNDFLDINRVDVNKGEALAWLGAQLGIATADMVAFGDGQNDIEMLQTVGLGVAMANAMDAVHEVADDKTHSNADSGVLTYLENLLDL